MQVYIQRGKTDGASPLVAVPYPPADLVRPPQTVFCRGKITFGQRFAYAGAADPAIIMTDRIHALHAETLCGADLLQQREIAFAFLAKAKIIAHIQVPDTHTVQKHLLHEFLGSQRSQVHIEFEQHHTIDTATADMDELFTQARQARWCHTGLKELHGLGFEKNNRRRQSQLLRLFPQCIENSLMPQMHTIKIADGRGTAAMTGTQIVLAAYELHVTDERWCQL